MLFDLTQTSLTVPEGYPTIGCFVVGAAQLTQQPVTEQDVQIASEVLHEDLHERSDIVNGKPFKLEIASWMVHADVANQNGQRFRAEDLERLAPTLSQAPDFLPMDWNHAAALHRPGDPPTIGVWYHIEYAFDEVAQAFGLFARGMVWAWLYPEQAAKMLAYQERHGYVPVSMMAVPRRLDHTFENGKIVATLIDPVFFTLSALDVRPADPHAVGRVTASGQAPATYWGQEGALAPLPHMLQVAKEIQMDEKLLEKLEALTAEKVALEAQVAELQTQVVQVTESAAAPLAEAETARAELETRIAELTTAREAITNELAATTARLEEQEAKLAQALAKLAEYEAAAETERKRARLEARLASLPAKFVEAHGKRAPEQRMRVEAKWAEMDDEAWKAYVEEELLVGFALAAGRYALRSEAEGGPLPNGGGAGVASRVQSLLK